jgi:hypothetical protein
MSIWLTESICGQEVVGEVQLEHREGEEGGMHVFKIIRNFGIILVYKSNV